MQGFNMGRYVPPEFEGLTSGNALVGKHALGPRANKSSQGILTVRFEMPFPIWCTSCPKPSIIGQGVRFNAEKKKVGNYYSTPILSFRMKHVACGGWIEIRTDPKNTAYVVTEGARKRDLGEDRVADGDVKIMTQEEREAVRADAFASLEGKVADKKRLEVAKDRLEELQEVQDQQWEDPYAKNKKLRQTFRVGREKRERDAEISGNLQDKMSLGIELLPENEEDARRAGFVEFGVISAEQAIAKAISKPLFAIEESNIDKSTKNKNGKSRMSRKLKAVELAEKRKADLVAEIKGNTRAKMDPFLQDKNPERFSSRIALGIKRKRATTDREVKEVTSEERSVISTGLVDYDSD